jgi:hypothetical protein
MDLFAERSLVLTVAGETTDVVVKLGKPVPDEATNSWKCPYEIWFGDNCYSHAMHGGDSLQALQLSMATLDMELRRGAKQRGGELSFLEEPFGSVLDDSGMQVKPS